jgi:hypothetical protein
MFENILSTELIVNIVLHVTILYTILANFFIFFITTITTDAINNELKHVVNDAFKPYIKNKDEITKKITELKLQYYELLKLTNNQNLQYFSKINDIKLQIENLTFLNYSLPKSSISVTNSIFGSTNFNINTLLNYFKNMSFEYYLDLFSTDNPIRKGINTQLFSQIHIVNVLLVLFLFVLVGTLIFSGGITYGILYQLILENVITFIFVGIIEFMFFLFIAIKFIPAPPSLIFKSLLSSIKSQL